MSKSRLPLFLGVAGVSGVGYYLYSAGGDTKVAQKKAEGLTISIRCIVLALRRPCID